MTGPQQVALGLLLLVLVMLSGLWLWQRLAVPEMARPPVASPTASAVASVTPTPTPLAAPPGYRLAGVAVGEPDSFAVIEAPNGTHKLFRLDAEVPGLGRLVRIESERVVVQSASGQFDMWLAPAATATPTPPRTAARPTPTRRPTARRPAGGSTPGSTSSIAPGRPAS